MRIYNNTAKRRWVHLNKKLFIGMTIGTAVLAAACGDTATVKENTTATSDLTLEEVFEKTLERQQELTSTKADMSISQNMEMTMGDESFNISTVSDMTMETVVKPMQLYAEGTTAMVDNESDEVMTMPLKMYMTEEDGFYLYEESMGGWFKMSGAYYEEILSQAGMQNDSSEQLKQLQQFVSDFTFEQTDKEFTLTLNAKGDKFMSFLLEQISGSLGEGSEDITTALESTNVENAKYVLTIDKETYDLTNMVMDLVMTMEVEGVTTKINQSSTINYYDFNSVESIVIPQEVIDTAQEMDF